jgi:parallel beta-helix repeat protein
MKREVRTLALRVAVPLTLLAVAPAQASTKISSCPYTITASGTYDVTQDLSCSGTAITILGSKVDLHLNGHTLSGNGAGDGISVSGQANVSIDNGTVLGFETGIDLQRTVDCKVTNVTASQNSIAGIIGRLATTGLTVTGCTAAQNGDWGLLITDSGGNTLTRNTANLNGGQGIEVGSGTVANTVTANTANQNGFSGIAVNSTSANTVTGNTADDNSSMGIYVHAASGNTLGRNTTDRNVYGIFLESNSTGNTVTRNSATANGDTGIRLVGGPAQNVVQNNTASGSFNGIKLDSGSTGNTIQGNTATLNILGIWLEAGATGNMLQGNMALNNGQWDLGDQNPGCDSNTWSSNKFVTDNVAGASDGGPGAGCIR